MKALETFKAVRSRPNRFSLRVRLTILVTAEIIFSLSLALALSVLLKSLLPNGMKMPWLLELAFFSLVISIVVTGFMSKLFFDPIKKLGKAMEKVSNGDFSVSLQTKSSSKEIQEMFSGFNMMVHELNATEVLQSDFVSNVSHEFKTPINAIEGYATLLQGHEGLDITAQEYVDKILFNTNRLSSLVGSILLLSKIESQSIQTNRTCFNLDEQIRQSVVAAERSWSAKSLELDVDLQSIEYTGNESLLYHVWDNLIGNAIKFSPEGGTITLRLVCHPGTAVFTIEDEGPGLSEEAQKHLFDKFYQGDSSHKQDGNGLGLTLVKRILTIMDGKITVENIPGKGCRFTVVLKN